MGTGYLVCETRTTLRQPAMFAEFLKICFSFVRPDSVRPTIDTYMSTTMFRVVRDCRCSQVNNLFIRTGPLLLSDHFQGSRSFLHVNRTGSMECLRIVPSVASAVLNEFEIKFYRRHMVVKVTRGGRGNRMKEGIKSNDEIVSGRIKYFWPGSTDLFKSTKFRILVLFS